jgi:hypothetical protein
VSQREGPRPNNQKPQPGEENLPPIEWGKETFANFRADDESPPVDIVLMHRYVVGAVSEAEMNRVQDMMSKYRPWVVAYQDELREAGLFAYPGEDRPLTYRKKSEL